VNAEPAILYQRKNLGKPDVSAIVLFKCTSSGEPAVVHGEDHGVKELAEWSIERNVEEDLLVILRHAACGLLH
jgi:hypothetical protein